MSSDNSVEVIGLDVEISSPDIDRIIVQETNPEASMTLNDGQDLWIEGSATTGGGSGGGSGGDGSIEAQLEAAFHTATNDHRESQGLEPYSYHDGVAAVARDHSQNMYEQDNLSHTLDGKDMTDRVNDAGIEYRSLGENIAYQSTDPIDGSQSQLDAIAQSFIDSWLTSSGHRQNIESSRESEGIGVYIDEGEDIVWATAMFITQ